MFLPLSRRVLPSAGLLLCALAPLLTPLAFAQDGAPNPGDPNGAAPAALAAATTVATGKRRVPTPIERRQQTEDKLRALMVNLGISAALTQDSVIEYLAEDAQGLANLRESENRLLQGLQREVPPERMRDLLSEHRAAIEADKANRIAAQRRLDVRVGYTLNAKLEAMLWVMGVLGDGASKLPTGALAVARPQAPEEVRPKTPNYGPLPLPNFGARGEIVGTVLAKGLGETNEHWLEIRDDSGALDRYTAPRREEIGAPDPEIEKLLAATTLGARVRVQWVWQERRRALTLQTESQSVTKIPAP